MLGTAVVILLKPYIMKIVANANITSIQFIKPTARGMALIVPITPEELFFAKFCASSIISDLSILFALSIACSKSSMTSTPSFVSSDKILPKRLCSAIGLYDSTSSVSFLAS